MDGIYTSFSYPYIIDLASTNGTYLNEMKIESQKYYQILHKDIIKFGLSDRQYVFMNNDDHLLQDNIAYNLKT